MNDPIFRQLRGLPNISRLLLEEGFPLLNETFDHGPKQVVRGDVTSYHPVVCHDEAYPMHANHRLRWDDVCRYFRKYRANHHLRGLQKKLK
jgi:hypothetical protein